MENTETEMQLSALDKLEQRYTLENHLMDAVSKGQQEQASRFLSALPFPLGDLQEARHLCIATDALLRKAAERGGVHPLHLDQVSERHCMGAEQRHSYHGLHSLFLGMSVDYCQLVHRFSTKGYALPVRKATVYIDANLSGELGLQKIADGLNLSASYLSALFKKETGKTITAYIQHRRIEYAKNLLETTSLQVQAVAQHCGIWDVHYFSRIFKQIVGMTPTAYRNAQKST